MADEVPAIICAEPLGWKTTDDGKYILIGFKTHEGEEAALALDQNSIRKFLLCAIDGTAAFPLQKGLGVKQDPMLLSTTWFEGGMVQTGEPYLTFFRENGAHLSFRLDGTMAHKIVETLNTILAGQSTPPAPEGQRH